ncbi:MAG TPA: GNAT family N-acetyltransferase [Haloplasmataceae bacterium]
MNYIFRKVNNSDVDSIWSLIQLLKDEKAEMSFTEINNKEEINNYIDNPANLTYVAVSNEEVPQVLCMVKGRRDLSIEKAHAVFLSCATHPLARGMRLATKLTNYALEEMKKEGVNIARIYVYSDNIASLNVVKKLGFIKSGVVLRHHKKSTGEYVDDIIFHKLLD